MGAFESRPLHLFIQVVWVNSIEKEEIKHTGIDMIVAYCDRSESLEHLCFRVEEYVWEYGINTSLHAYEDHPDHTCFSIGIQRVLIPPLDGNGDIIGNPSVACEMDIHWESFIPDTQLLRKLILKETDQVISCIGTWVAASGSCQCFALCAGSKVRAMPDHDGLKPKKEINVQIVQKQASIKQDGTLTNSKSLYRQSSSRGADIEGGGRRKSIENKTTPPNSPLPMNKSPLIERRKSAIEAKKELGNQRVGSLPTFGVNTSKHQSSPGSSEPNTPKTPLSPPPLSLNDSINENHESNQPHPKTPTTPTTRQSISDGPGSGKSLRKSTSSIKESPDKNYRKQKSNSIAEDEEQRPSTSSSRRGSIRRSSLSTPSSRPSSSSRRSSLKIQTGDEGGRGSTPSPKKETRRSSIAKVAPDVTSRRNRADSEP